ncbi:hypothetical protein Tco_0211410 [Tanacetum coccineum]
MEIRKLVGIKSKLFGKLFLKKTSPSNPFNGILGLTQAKLFLIHEQHSLIVWSNSWLKSKASAKLKMSKRKSERFGRSSPFDSKLLSPGLLIIKRREGYGIFGLVNSSGISIPEWDS